MNNSPNNQTKTPEQIIEEVMRKRGKMVLAVADVSGDVKKTAMGVAVDAIEKWEENREKKGIDKVPIIGGIKGSVERSAQLNKYFKTAKQAIKETGSLSAAGLAIDEINKGTDLKAVNKRGEKVYLENIRDNLEANGFDDTVARRLAIAKEEGEDSEDKNVVVDEKYEQEDDLKKAFADYVRGSVDAYGKKNTAKRGKAKAEAEDNLEAAIRTLNEDRVVAGNYDEIKSDLDTMMDNLKSAGYLAKGKANESKREEAFAAIDKYLADNLSVLSGKVETGLAAKEAYANLKDKAVLKYGVVVGVTAGVLGGAVSAITKNKIISNITNSSLVATGIRAGVAGVIGGVKGYRAEGNKQARENVKQALSGEEFEGDDKKYEIVSVEKKIEAMDALLEGNKLKTGKYDEAATMIAELRARNELQNKYHIQMLGFNGRKDVEASKYEMFKMIADLKKAMKAEKGDVAEDDIRKAYDLVMNGGKNDAGEDVIGLMSKVSAVHGKQVGERWKAGAKSGLIAAGVAGAIDFAFHFNQNVDEIKALANGSKHFEGLNLVATEATGATGAVVSEAVNGGENQEAINEMKGKPVLIEEDEQGGVAVGIDANGNGKIDAGEYLRGEGEMKGIDLTNDKELAVLQGELHDKYEIDLNYETIKSAKYGEVEIGQYLEKAGNTVDQNIDNVDWGKSATKVVFGNPVSVSADGMDYYEVSVSGVNGGAIPEGAKFFIDLDGKGPGKALEFAIQDGKAIIPADIVDTSTTGVGGVAKFIGMARVGEFDGDKMISYATAFGKSAELGDKISAAMAEDVRAFTATSAVTGERLSQFAVNGDNAIISNMSEIFNGIEVGESERLPSVFKVNDIGDGQADLKLASNEVVKDFDVEGGYHPEFDAFENTPFKASDTYLGTPMTWDIDGDGELSAIEEASYVKQLLVRTGTNPYMLGQNASNYGILEPDRLENIIPTDVLKGWGIIDGVVDSEEELNILMTALKERANADYWDKLANATINEMETQLMGGGFEVGTVTERLSTYANSQRMFDTANSSTTRTVLYPYRNVMNEEGNVVGREYVGNRGWWCRKYGAEGGKVGDLPLCEQKSIEKIATPKPTPKPTTTTPTTTPTEPVEPPSTPTTPVKPIVPEVPTEPEVPTTPTEPVAPVTPVTPTEPVNPEPGIIPKSPENMVRINDQINEDIINDIGTESTVAQQAANEAAEQIIESGGIPQSAEDVVDDYWAQFGY